jgi:hypothetical protein
MWAIASLMASEAMTPLRPTTAGADVEGCDGDAVHLGLDLPLGVGHRGVPDFLLVEQVEAEETAGREPADEHSTAVD